MGLFGGNYSRPGKGVSKEEALKRNYFDILGRKFWKLIQLNMLYFLCNILFFGAFAFMTVPLFFATDENAMDTVIKEMILPILTGKQLIPLAYFIPFVFIGPTTAGLTYVTRNYSKQEHAFLMSDFFEHTKKNFKQGILTSLIFTVVTYFYLTAVIFYFNVISYKPLVLAFALILGILVATTSFYVYPIMVTFDMKLRHIFKNALIFALAKLPQNIFILAIVAAVHILLLFFASPLIWAVLMVFLLIAWSSYTINYYTWHVIDKHMMSQVKTDDNLKEEAIFDDEIHEK